MAISFVAGPEQSREDPLGKRGREVHRWHLGDERATEADETAAGWLMSRSAYSKIIAKANRVLNRNKTKKRKKSKNSREVSQLRSTR